MRKMFIRTIMSRSEMEPVYLVERESGVGRRDEGDLHGLHPESGQE